MIYHPRKPQKLGAEARESERAILKEVEDLANKAVDNCPECGSADYHPVDGCFLCRSCGFSPCGGH